MATDPAPDWTPVRRSTTEAGARRRAGARLAARAGTGAGAGLLAAATTTTVDRLAGLTLPVPVDHVQILLATLVGATITVVVFALWMRTVVVGLLSDQVSPRVVTAYLDDGTQRWLIAVGIGMIAFLAGALLGLPDPTTGGDPPALTLTIGILAALAATAGVLWSVQVAVRDLSLPHVVRQVADGALQTLERRVLDDDRPPAEPPGEDAERLTARDLGWVTAVDRDALLGAIEPGTTVSLDADVGDFVTPHQVLVRVDRQLGDEARTAVLDAVTIGRTRSSHHDLAYALQPLVDVAEHAMSATSNDTSTAHEALVHLRAVLHEVVQRGTSTGWRTDGEGRWLRRAAVRTPADHVAAAVDRLAAVVSTAPMRDELRELLRPLRDTAAAVGDEGCRAHLDHRLDELVPDDGARRGG